MTHFFNLRLCVKNNKKTVNADSMWLNQIFFIIYFCTFGVVNPASGVIAENTLSVVP